MTGFQVDSDGAEDKILKGATDGTQIGNVTDRLKVIDADTVAAINALSINLGIGAANIFKFNELALTARTETDLSGVTYTVPSGKTFAINSFSGSYDAQAALYVRLKKQTGGTGSFVTILRLNMMTGGQGNSTLSYDFGKGFAAGVAGDVFKVTVEASIAKGTIFAMFTGSEL